MIAGRADRHSLFLNGAGHLHSTVIAQETADLSRDFWNGIG